MPYEQPQPTDSEIWGAGHSNCHRGVCTSGWCPKGNAGHADYSDTLIGAWTFCFCVAVWKAPQHHQMNLKLMFSQPGLSHKSLFSTGFLVPLRFIVMIRHTLGHQTSPSIPLILHLGDFATSPGVEWSKRPREVRDDQAHDALFFATLARACQIYSQESYTRLQEFHSHSI